MASIFSETPVYLSYDEAKDSTNITELKTVAKSKIERYILEAQRMIDNFIGSYGEAVSEDQKTIFPTVDDAIPQDIKEATLYIVEALYQYWDRLNIPWSQVVQESVGDHTVKYSEAEKINSIDDLMPLKAKDILKQYGSSFVQQSLHQNNMTNAIWIASTRL